MLPIRTERLLIRKFREEDIADMAQYTSDEEVMRYHRWNPYDEKGVKNYLEWQKDFFPGMDGQMCELAIELVSEKKVIGAVGIEVLSHKQGEIAFLLNRAYQGKGFASEAVRALMKFGFEFLGLHRIIAISDARNMPSQKLMEKMGMRQEAHFVQNAFRKKEWCDEKTYAILASEFLHK